MLLTATLFLALLGPQEPFDTPDPTDEGVKTGPDVGEPAPAFEATDADGRAWNLESLKGPNGAVLLFFRSADW